MLITQPTVIRYKLVQQAGDLGQQTEASWFTSQHFQITEQAEAIIKHTLLPGEHTQGCSVPPSRVRAGSFQAAVYLRPGETAPFSWLF